MPQVYYDLHIHSALSPCADDDMTPCDIAGMAIVNGLDMIAITDHNSFANAKAVADAAGAVCRMHDRERELIVLIGAEITTAEEVHALCLFDSVSSAQAFEEELSAYYTQLKNREDIFGSQIIYSGNDEITGYMERMLMAPTTVSFEALFALTQKYDGAFVPAHVDRPSFSVMSNLGFLPPDLDIAAVEFTSRGDTGNAHDFDKFPGRKYVFSSDAHQLHIINDKRHYMTLPELSGKAAIDYLRF